MKYGRKGLAFSVLKGLNIPENAGCVLPFNDCNSNAYIAQRYGLATTIWLSNVECNTKEND